MPKENLNDNNLGPEKENKFQNILTDPDSALEAVIAAEAAVSPQGAERAKDAIREQISRAAEETRERLEEAKNGGREVSERIPVSGFQGVGGFNRYRVFPDGSIAILKSHSFGESIKKAEELGIGVEEF